MDITSTTQPVPATPCPKCGEPDYNPFEEWEAEVTEQLNQLNALPEDEFSPSLTVLDDVIKTIRIDP